MPIELVRYIVEDAIARDVALAAQLCLVSRSVNALATPTLYRDVALSTPRQLDAFMDLLDNPQADRLIECIVTIQLCPKEPIDAMWWDLLTRRGTTLVNVPRTASVDLSRALDAIIRAQLLKSGSKCRLCAYVSRTHVEVPASLFRLLADMDNLPHGITRFSVRLDDPDSDLRAAQLFRDMASFLAVANQAPSACFCFAFRGAGAPSALHYENGQLCVSSGDARLFYSVVDGVDAQSDWGSGPAALWIGAVPLCDPSI